MPMQVLVLGAGFGGLELAATTVREAPGADIEVTLIDKSDSFVFGYSKLDVMFGRVSPNRSGCRTATWPSPACGCCARRSRRSTRRPAASRRTPARTRRMCSSSRSAPTTTSLRRPASRRWHEFYSVAGAERLAGTSADSREGHAIDRRLRRAVQVPAGAERCALLLHDYLTARGVRDACEICSSSRSDADSAVARHLRGALPPSPSATSASSRPARRLPRCRRQRRRARRRQRAALRLLPRRPEAPRSRRRASPSG